MTRACALVFIDGGCGVCRRAADFVLRRDRKGRFRVAALQSDEAQRRLVPAGIDPRRTDSVVLCEGSRMYTMSSAVIRIAMGLGGAWKAAGVFLLVPRPLRDGAYRFFARHRHSCSRQ